MSSQPFMLLRAAELFEILICYIVNLDKMCSKNYFPK